MNIIGLKIFESYKGNKQNYNNNNSKNNNECKNSKQCNGATSKYDAKTNKKIISINPDTNNDIRDELYSLYIINNV